MRSLKWLTIGLFVVTLSGCLKSSDPQVDSSVQLAADMEKIDAFLATNNIIAIKDKSGIRFHIDVLGTGGLPPKTDQQIKVNYQGYFLGGGIFDAGGEATNVLNKYITGWQLGLSLWPPGTKGTIWVPSPLGYGDQPVGPVPANSILVFDVTLKEVLPSNAEKARLASDLVVIDKYLSDHKITALTDTTGVRYVITNQGSGPVPTWYDRVRFNYIGKAMATGNEFFNGTSAPNDGFDSRMCDFLHGIKIGLSKIGTGGKVTVYIPSGLAFGPYENTQTSLPANSNIIYDIELLEITPQ